MGEAHLILESKEAGPSALDKRVVRGDDGNDIHALRLELFDLLEEWREVIRVARGLEKQDASVPDRANSIRKTWMGVW